MFKIELLTVINNVEKSEGVVLVPNTLTTVGLRLKKKAQKTTFDAVPRLDYKNGMSSSSKQHNPRQLNQRKYGPEKDQIRPDKYYLAPVCHTAA